LAPLHHQKELLFEEMANIAYAGQYHLEQILLACANFLYRKTKSKNLCIAGGVALNSVANYKILENTHFENIFIQPAAGDAGTSIGAALYGYYHIMDQPMPSTKEKFSPYLGKNYSKQSIEQAIGLYKEKLLIVKPEHLFKETAKILSEGKIIGWFQGKSEIGPRALGNRSILADARNKDMKDSINSRIKHREAFRPFAPLVLENKQADYFSTDHPSYYMLLVPYIHEAKRDEVPSITHVDGTGRVQTVSETMNPVLHDLLSAFYDLTGTPILLNTSFNDNGEPIVETPTDAIECFLNIDLDYLIMDDYILSKK
jgi:carbamoyltransferase